MERVPTPENLLLQAHNAPMQVAEQLHVAVLALATLAAAMQGILAHLEDRSILVVTRADRE